MTYLFNFTPNTIEYQFDNPDYNEKHIAKEAIKDIIVKATPSSSCWWSKLKRRTDKAKDAIGEIALSQQAKLKGEPVIERGETAKTCSGILNLFNKTYLIKSPTDIVITINSKEDFRWDSSNQALVNLTLHNKEQFISDGDSLFKEKMCFKIEIKVKLRTKSQGYLMTEPYYHNTLGLASAPGYISDIYSNSSELNMFIFIDIPKEGTTTLTIPKGSVLQYLIPDKKSNLVHRKERFVASLLNTRFSKKRKK